MKVTCGQTEMLSPKWCKVDWENLILEFKDVDTGTLSNRRPFKTLILKFFWKTMILPDINTFISVGFCFFFKFIWRRKGKKVRKNRKENELIVAKVRHIGKCVFQIKKKTLNLNVCFILLLYYLQSPGNWENHFTSVSQCFYKAELLKAR